MEDLEVWRQKIDEIDVQLVKLLNERAICAREIGKIKLQLGMEAYTPARELEVMQNVISHGKGPLSEEALRRLYERIIDESRSVERIFMDGQKKKRKGRA